MKRLRLPLIVAILILSTVLMHGKIPHERFSSEVWKTANLNSEENMSIRWDMMNDLRSNHKLVGMTRQEIIELLGQPGDTARLEFRYYLGYSRTGINTGTLTITFNDKDIVTAINVWQG